MEKPHCTNKIFLARRSARYGFSLIEVLVVIAIIGILATVVFNSLQYARKDASDAATKLNLHNIIDQASLYFQNNSTYTGLCDPTNTDSNALTPLLYSAEASSLGTTTPTPNAALGKPASFTSVTCHEDGTDWAVEAPLQLLVNAAPALWCVDSSGTISPEATPLGANSVNCNSASPGTFAGGTNGECFTASSTASSFLVFQQAPPPQPGQSNYNYYPINAAGTLQMNTLATALPGTDTYYWLWANRCAPKAGSVSGDVNGCVSTLNGKGNEFSTLIKVPDNTDLFSSYKYADDCTLAQAAYALGEDQATATSYLQGDAVQAVPYTQAQSLITGGQFKDICIMSQVQDPAMTGILVDYEVADGRTTDMTQNFLLQLVALAHANGKNIILYIDPLDAPTQPKTGINATNAPTLMNAFDYITLMLWSGNTQGNIAQSFASQMQVLRGTNGTGTIANNKLMVTFELANTTMTDAQTVRNLMLQNGISAVNLWRNGATQGGDCSTATNQKTICLLYGQCSGS